MIKRNNYILFNKNKNLFPLFSLWRHQHLSAAVHCLPSVYHAHSGRFLYPFRNFSWSFQNLPVQLPNDHCNLFGITCHQSFCVKIIRISDNKPPLLLYSDSQRLTKAVILRYETDRLTMRNRPFGRLKRTVWEAQMICIEMLLRFFVVVARFCGLWKYGPGHGPADENVGVSGFIFCVNHGNDIQHYQLNKI